MRNWNRRIGSLVGVLALTVVACAAPAGDGVETTEPPGRVGRIGDSGRAVALQGRHALVAFDSCEPFLDYVISQAIDLVGPYGLGDPRVYPVFLEDRAALAAEDTAGADGESSFSGTNVQVLGVDEPDIVKTDGKRIVVLSEGRLIVADVTGAEPEIIGEMTVGEFSVQNLFLSGDTVLMFGSTWTAYPLFATDAEFAPNYQAPTLQIIEVDITGDPEIVRKMSIDGSFVSGRMIGDSVRLVVSSGPVGFEWSYPKGSGLRAERRAIEENQEILRNSTEENWIPYYLTTDSEGRVVDEGILFGCDRATHPEEFSGLNMLSVVTIDIADGLDVVDSTGVLANGDTVYASADNLYVATQNWQTWNWRLTDAAGDRVDEVTTDIHKFDISRPDFTDYVATGRVQGYLLNQFAMDENEGLLRVASTSQPSWWGGGFDTESMITILDEDDGELVEIGHVDGLGETEQIYSVRFMGDIAYVVTFRQTDPLYTVDLSDPTHPEVVGELKILGYSAYLHPLREGLLLGVGQDATDAGRVRGTQVSVFDVSDPSDPVRIDAFTLSEGSSSEAEYNHHAFLYWEETGLVVIPVQQWRWDGKNESGFFGAIGLNVDDDGDLREVSRVVHPGGDDDGWDWQAQIQRSIVIGDSIYTVSAKGMMKSDLGSLQEIDWLEF